MTDGGIIILMKFDRNGIKLVLGSTIIIGDVKTILSKPATALSHDTNFESCEYSSSGIHLVFK